MSKEAARSDRGNSETLSWPIFAGLPRAFRVPSPGRPCPELGLQSIVRFSRLQSHRMHLSGTRRYSTTLYSMYCVPRHLNKLASCGACCTELNVPRLLHLVKKITCHLLTTLEETSRAKGAFWKVSSACTTWDESLAHRSAFPTCSEWLPRLDSRLDRAYYIVCTMYSRPS